MKNRSFWNWPLAGCVTLIAGIGLGRDLDQDCWFAAGFDGPALLNGGPFPADVDARLLTAGRHGQACHFHGETENRLPAMAEFLNNGSNFFVRGQTKLTTGATLKSSGGAFGVRPRPVPVRSRTPWNYKRTAYTCSCYVKGRAGETVTLRAFAEPFTADELKRIEKSCSGEFDKPSKVAMRPDVSSNRVWKLTGAWQRVYAFVRFDHRAKFTGRPGLTHLKSGITSPSRTPQRARRPLLNVQVCKCASGQTQFPVSVSTVHTTALVLILTTRCTPARASRFARCAALGGYDRLHTCTFAH